MYKGVEREKEAEGERRMEKEEAQCSVQCAWLSNLESIRYRPSTVLKTFTQGLGEHQTLCSGVRRTHCEGETTAP